MTQQASGEAIFGSVSRCDGDSLSDRDILIVDADTKLLTDRRAYLEKRGWSVASYTPAKLKALARKGALFIQHLKMEATITRDTAGELGTILNGFQPKESYELEIFENASLAALAAFRPRGSRGTLWAADVLYVAVRNHGILSLAQRKRYTFAYADVLKGLLEEKLIGPSALPHLLELRVAKSAYRGQLSYAGAASTLQKSLRSLPRSFFPMTSVAEESRRLVQRAWTLSNSTLPYVGLRNLERAYLALEEHHSTPSPLAQTIIAWIENPRAYAFLASQKAPEQIALIWSELVKLEAVRNVSDRHRARPRMRFNLTAGSIS